MHRKNAQIETSPEEVQRLIYDLQNHRAELEAQNEELRRAQIQLSDARDRYQDLYDFAPVAFVTLDSGGVIQEANFAAANLLMVERARLIGRPLEQFVARRSRQDFVAHLQLVRREASRKRESVLLLNSQGDVLTVQLESVAEDMLTSSANDKAGTTRVAIVDLTERAKAESALRESERQLRRLNTSLQEENIRKDEFLAMLAHELRNPLAAIGCAVRISGSFTDPEKIEWAHQVLQRQTAHLSRMVNDLLDVSRITRGKVQLKTHVVDVSAVLRSAIDALENIRAARHHQIETDIEDGLFMKADSTRIEQIVGNLLANAYKYTPDHGKISLKAARVGTKIQLKISDNGVGIAPEMLPKVFDLFVQAPVTLERSKGGLGIGLTLVKQLVEMHGGQVMAESSGPGQGSTFVVILPAVAARAETSKTEDRVHKVDSHVRVLIVEDNYDSGVGMRELLEMEGFIVRLISDGKEAVARAREFIPDYILLDIGLPGMDGYQVARALRQDPAFSHTLIIAISGYGREEDMRKSSEAGFDFHLVKPLDIDELLRILARSPEEHSHQPHSYSNDSESALPAV